jgi:hypothetical protein
MPPSLDREQRDADLVAVIERHVPMFGPTHDLLRARLARLRAEHGDDTWEDRRRRVLVDFAAALSAIGPSLKGLGLPDRGVSAGVDRALQAISEDAGALPDVAVRVTTRELPSGDLTLEMESEGRGLGPQVFPGWLARELRRREDLEG